MKHLLKVVIIIALLFVIPVSARAETDKGISVSPSIMQLDLDVDKPEYSITYTNNTNDTIILTFAVKDFTGLEDGWKVSFLENEDSEQYRYSLYSWININRSSLTLKPQETGTINISVDTKELAPGGHYAAIIANVQTSEISVDLNVNAHIASLLLLRTTSGNIIEKATISSLIPLRRGFTHPYDFLFKFENKGNVDLTPYGTISLINPVGKLVAKHAINEGSIITLPESIKKYEILTSKGSFFLIPGMYRAKLDIRYGKQKIKLSKNIQFFSTGSITVLHLLIFAVLIAIVLLRKKIISLIFRQN